MIGFVAITLIVLLHCSNWKTTNGQFASFQLFPGPLEKQDYLKWFQAAAFWRLTSRFLEPSSGPGLNWTSTSYVQAQTLVWDRMLFDETTQKFTVRKYLNKVAKRYGGLDSILLWYTYPNLGVDDRTQFDLLEALPDGGMERLTRDFNKYGVKVLINYIPWDQATRRVSESDYKLLVTKLSEYNVDGFNGDTMVRIPQEFLIEAQAQGKVFAMQPEAGGFDTTSRPWTGMSWGYYGDIQGSGGEQVYGHVPGIAKYKWLDQHGEFMVQVCDRFSLSKIDALQYALFNGIGIQTWENVWGIYNTLTDRDVAAIRRVSTLLRYLGSHKYITGYRADGWFPHCPEVFQPDVYGSRFEHESGNIVWTLVNRGTTPISGMQINPRFVLPPLQDGKFYDLYNGVVLSPTNLSFAIEGKGFGVVLYVKTENKAPSGLHRLVHQMRKNMPLSSYSAAFAPLQQNMVDEKRIKSMYNVRPDLELHKNMVYIPGTNEFHFKVAGVEIEGGCDATIGAAEGNQVCCVSRTFNCEGAMPTNQDKTLGVDVQFPWEDLPQRFHNKVIAVGPFTMDKYPVTREQYQRFLNVTRYCPRDARNFLQEWDHVGHSWIFPEGTAKLPVTSVSLDEARAYCAWLGKRLPESYEWQYAAQGLDGRKYPWGDTLSQRNFPDTSQEIHLHEVDSFDHAASPFNVSSLIGNVWQWTSEFQDLHTRHAVLRGGSSYNLRPSTYHKPSIPAQPYNWYIRQTLRLDRQNKLMLLSESYDRAKTIGFRCIRDIKREFMATLSQQ